MKAKVVKEFRDKHSGKLHRVGDVISVSKERFDEILTVGLLVEAVKVKKAAETEEKTEE